MIDVSKQAGKGLSGFMVGLLLATAVIAGVLFFLNQNKTPFKPTQTAQPAPAQPDILTPGTPAPPPPPPASDVLGDFITEQTASEPAASAPAPAKPPIAESKPETDKPAKPPVAERKPPATEPKVTPEQILNSGSLEKAQQAARKPSATPATNRDARVMLQIGSFRDSAAADAQRAKLAMLGVDTQVVQSQANGQTVFRVQTGKMNRQQAEQTAERLRQNSIDSLVRNAP